VNEYVKTVAEKLAKLDYVQRGRILGEVIQNMNERADSGSSDKLERMEEIAAFLVAQLGGDADEVVEGHLPAKERGKQRG
jgi:hypothetical protein